MTKLLPTSAQRKSDPQGPKPTKITEYRM